MNLNLSKLSAFSQEAYHKIIERHPDWEKYAKLTSYRKGSFMTIEIPAPIPEIPPIEIIAESDDLNEITVYFGMAHYHMGIYLRKRKRTLNNQIDGIDEITGKIFNEELIAVQQNPGLFLVAEGMATLDEYQKLLEKGKLRKAVSWNGTYNYPKDGSHLDWNPKIRT